MIVCDLRTHIDWRHRANPTEGFHSDSKICADLLLTEQERPGVWYPVEWGASSEPHSNLGKDLSHVAIARLY